VATCNTFRTDCDYVLYFNRGLKFVEGGKQRTSSLMKDILTRIFLSRLIRFLKPLVSPTYSKSRKSRLNLSANPLLNTKMSPLQSNTMIFAILKKRRIKYLCKITLLFKIKISFLRGFAFGSKEINLIKIVYK